jgi:hypothetical protein
MKALINNKEVEFKVLSQNRNEITLEIDNKEFRFNKSDLTLNISTFGDDQFQVFDSGIEAYARILPKAKRSGVSGAKEGSLLEILCYLATGTSGTCEV